MTTVRKILDDSIVGLVPIVNIERNDQKQRIVYLFFLHYLTSLWDKIKNPEIMIWMNVGYENYLQLEQFRFVLFRRKMIYYLLVGLFTTIQKKWMIWAQINQYTWCISTSSGHTRRSSKKCNLRLKQCTIFCSFNSG